MKLCNYSSEIKNSFQNQVIGLPIKSAAGYSCRRSPVGYLPAPDVERRISCLPGSAKQGKADSVMARINRLSKKADDIASGFWEHVRLGPKISETVKGKLSLGAKILQVGGVEKIFKQLFAVSEGDKLLKACQCYLSTSAGPIAGLLFITSDKIAFCSERSIKLSSPDGRSIRVHYKVLIPSGKIKRVNQSKNVKNPSRKYIQVVTVDNFDFWFMGFLNYQTANKHILQAISPRSDDSQIIY
ncbi:hypothetical protein K2173_001109 [Erythroxylum novogranatense]|uniref:GRAM domain-containing protein n=1 Tax=Erythroxylum novogranatense TaxID=1862640 RepID=A0AAV8SIN6_9ROSI|nr:hypothetical protein K2173_001109 [Erythroxylum novogranatense]